MKVTIVFLGASLWLGIQGCYVECTDGSVINVLSSHQTPCAGNQKYIYAQDGYADIVHFDGRPDPCVYGIGFGLMKIPHNVIGCENGVRWRSCVRNRC